MTPGPGHVAAPISHSPRNGRPVSAGVGGDGALGERLHERVLSRGVVAWTSVPAGLGEVGRCGQVAFEHESLEAGDVELRLRHHAVGERLGGCGIPPVGAVRRPASVPARGVRGVEHLEAHDGPPGGRACGVHGGRLVPRDRGVLGQQPGLRLAHRGHERVDAASEVQRAAGVEPAVLEARARRQREIDLKAAALVAIAGCLLAHALGHPGHGAQQPPVQLVGGGGGDHRFGGVDRVPGDRPNAGGAAVAHDDLVDVDSGVHIATALGHEPDERVGQAAAASDRGRITAGESGQSDHRPQGAGRILGPGAEVQRPRCRERPQLFGVEVAANQIDGAAREQLAERERAVAPVAEQTHEPRLAPADLPGRRPAVRPAPADAGLPRRTERSIRPSRRAAPARPRTPPRRPERWPPARRATTTPWPAAPSRTPARDGSDPEPARPRPARRRTPDAAPSSDRDEIPGRRARPSAPSRRDAASARAGTRFDPPRSGTPPRRARCGRRRRTRRRPAVEDLLIAWIAHAGDLRLDSRRRGSR